VGARSKARKRALDVLYEADIRACDMTTVAQEHGARRRSDDGAEVHPYTGELVLGVSQRQERIDELLSTYSHGWTLSRMPALDRNILRISTFELLWGDEVPDAVVLAEAVILAKELSTDESPAFINGLLARIKDVRPTLDLTD
jgi:N utilization substance protein B